MADETCPEIAERFAIPPEVSLPAPPHTRPAFLWRPVSMERPVVVRSLAGGSYELALWLEANPPLSLSLREGCANDPKKLVCRVAAEVVRSYEPPESKVTVEMIERGVAFMERSGVASLTSRVYDPEFVESFLRSAMNGEAQK